MPLTACQVKSAEPREKDYKLYDEKGLLLLVKKSGAKYWRFKYRLAGKEKMLALGVFPEVTLAHARKLRDHARHNLQNDIDPGEQRQAKRQAGKDAAQNAFEVIALEWLEKRGKKSESGDKRLKALLERDLFPKLGKTAISEIKPPQLLAVLRRIESRGAVETAHRAKQYAGQIFRYAVATGRAERDITADLTGALATPQKKHLAAITTPREAGLLYANIQTYQGTPTVQAALKLAPLLFCRPGELRRLEWEEINWAKRQIELPAEKMKTKEPHIIPLSDQALAILEDLRDHHKRGKYVFPSARGASRPLSENGVRTALRSMGYDNETMTPHGFRAMARTLLDEELNYRVEWIEQQLGHAVKDVHGRAYNRTKHLEQRRKMMQHWSDYLDQLKAETETGNVITADFGSTSTL
ncbi:integrase arm-type DNA-binding domain-containing protein [Gilvimarinus agarilyticus]|uniref:tyrosine-type recombinase/integrase n=1 Tax=Gilvimarinus sp. 2_MG-2023 TaxID=3062666 RepID=UPI001C082248|nr:integrase arm-type DNA-binding domain-containing protein [Gilvimarinus sp. 2_MG-2023]MBU2887467.1 integrase arm-type DNA-binding domain-containing protein [Gilvimarinus agarilyticus]MDO6572120.1 integrase arm-type DNA-binding domain-containing protein [Gilvimarinus sp. 2_MG-2023]